MSAGVTMTDALQVLRERFGYETFRAGQERAVRAVIDGRDALVVLPTGGGKSLCFQIPALIFPGLTVVVSPLISLMKDQVDALRARDLPAAFINSTLTGSQIADRLYRAQRGELKLLYVAPERFDVGTSAERLRAAGVSLLAVDEAHCISEWGHDFRPSYQRLGALRLALGDPPVIALTATATPAVRRDIAKQLGLRNPEIIVTGFDRKNLRYHVVSTRSQEQKDQALSDLLKKHDLPAIIYASTRRAVERLGPVLESHGIRAVAYHGGLDDAKRRRVQDAFMAEDAKAVVATNAFGMGIDKRNVRLVVHYAMPGSMEAYYQEAGRAGRDGLAADCCLLHAFKDRFTHEFFVNCAYPDRDIVARIYDALRRNTFPNVDAIAERASVKSQEVDSTLRLLTRVGAFADTQIGIRLCATPDRIKSELDGSSLEVLRALWRAAGRALHTGVAVDLMALPRELGGIGRIQAVLAELEARGFVATKPGTGLTNPEAPLDSFAIDWDSQDRRRRADLSKVDAVQRYAYATTCRRAFVLRYFGDPAADEADACAGCDNCLGTRRVADTHAAPRPKARHREAPAVVGPSDGQLYDALRVLRSEIAKRDRVPAYVVFADKTLAELAVRKPRSKNALLDVRGIGPAKVEKYGEQVLTLIRGAH
jgi:ATP-dependent DNA helicase RecQ